MNVEIEAFTTDIRMIVIGNVFEWCLRNGEADFGEYGTFTRKISGQYIRLDPEVSGMRYCFIIIQFPLPRGRAIWEEVQKNWKESDKI